METESATVHIWYYTSLACQKEGHTNSMVEFGFGY